MRSKKLVPAKEFQQKLFSLTEDERAVLKSIANLSERTMSLSWVRAAISRGTVYIEILTARTIPYYQEGMQMEYVDLKLVDTTIEKLTTLEDELEQYSRLIPKLRTSAEHAKVLLRGIKLKDQLPFQHIPE